MEKQSPFQASLQAVLRDRLAGSEHALAAAFAQRFWARIPEEDLREWEPAAAGTVTIAALRHFGRRQPDAVDIAVRNPEYERDGWSSSHTVVLIAHPDMPFITDSVLMQLSQHDIITHHLQNVVFETVRDPAGALLRLGPGVADARTEVLVYAEIDRLEDDRLADLERRLATTLADVRSVVADFQWFMRAPAWPTDAAWRLRSRRDRARSSAGLRRC